MKQGTIIKRLGTCLKFHPGFRRKIKDIEEITIHGTGGGQSANGLLKWIESGERARQYKRGIALFHFLIGRLGEIYQLAPIDRWYYHSSSGKHDKKTIGIELLNPEPVNAGGYTERQYVALEDLMFNLLFEACPNVSRIVSHDYNSNNYSGYKKGCPGAQFSWMRVRDMFKSRNVDLTSKVFEDLIEFHPLMLKVGGMSYG